MKTAILNSGGMVVNIVELPAGSDWAPGGGFTLGSAGGEIGDVWNGAGYVKPNVQPAALTEADYQSAVQDHVDQTARARLYSDGVSLSTYAASTHQKWASEATAFIAWRDAVWLYALAELDKVRAGTRTAPGIAQILNELPKISWPAA